MIKGAIFDMDGVLVDNVRYHMRAWKQLGSEFGITLTEDAIKRVFGQRNREIIKSLIGDHLSEAEISDCAVRKEVLYRGFMKPELKPVAGLIDFLSELKQEGLKTAVASSGPRDNVAMVLDGLDIRGFFDSVVTGADIIRSKPDPEIFLLAAKNMALAPTECAVFEDSSSGIEAARRAHCRCIALATTHTREKLLDCTPDQIIKDFSDISVAYLRTL